MGAIIESNIRRTAYNSITSVSDQEVEAGACRRTLVRRSAFSKICWPRRHGTDLGRRVPHIGRLAENELEAFGHVARPTSICDTSCSWYPRIPTTTFSKSLCCLPITVLIIVSTSVTASSPIMRR